MANASSRPALSPTPPQGPGSVPTLTAISLDLNILARELATWATRDDSKAQPEVTRAGHAAVEAIDGMLAELHRARQQLVTEIRQDQDAAVARLDELLQRSKADRLAERAMDIIDRAVVEGELPG